MKLLKTFLLLLSLTLISTNCGSQEMSDSNSKNNSNDNILVIELKDGKVEIEMFPDVAPGHVERIKTLANQGFYDGIVFHRVIEGFMVQTGDPTGTGMGGSELPDLKAEFSKITHKRGVASMARSANPNSANSQFFIMLEDSTHLDGQYSAWGKVRSGMEFVDAIKKGDQRRNGTVEQPDSMIKVYTISAQ